MSEWISVKERLPDYSGTFICLDLKGKEVEWFDSGVLTPAFHDIFGAGFSNGRFYDYLLDGNEYTIDVSHWMPFPKSGKQIKENQ